MLLYTRLSFQFQLQNCIFWRDPNLLSAIMICWSQILKAKKKVLINQLQVKFDLMWDYLWFMFICAIHITLFSCGKDNNLGLDSDALVSTGGVNRWLIDDRYLERKIDPYSQKKRNNQNSETHKTLRFWDKEMWICKTSHPSEIFLEYFTLLLNVFKIPNIRQHTRLKLLTSSWYRDRF